MKPRFVEYVTENDVLADIAIKAPTSANLRTTNAIILASLLLSSYILNIVLITTIYTSKKLRNSLIYAIFAHIGLVNILHLSFSVLISLLFVANGNWIFGDEWCRINATVQEFCQLYTMLLLMLAAVERAVGLSFDTQLMPVQKIYQQPAFFTMKRILILAVLLAVVSMAVSIPSAAVLPVKPFRNRYVCSVSSGAPLGYTLTRVVLYIGCLCVLLVCLSAIFKKPGINSLPQQSQDYSDFIRRNRARQEYLSRAKLPETSEDQGEDELVLLQEAKYDCEEQINCHFVVLLVCTFILVAGPYITLSFTFEITNSMEFLADNELLLEIPQDADTLITWLMFLFPLLSPIIIFCWCTDVWSYAKELFCCRSDNPPTVGYFARVNGIPPVMTLVATPEGLQLKLPSSGLNPPDNSSQTLPAPQHYPEMQVPDMYPAESSGDEVQIRVITKPTSDVRTKHTASTSSSKESLPTQRRSKIKPPAAKGVIRPVKAQGGGVTRGKTVKRAGANARRPK